jgi:hypothetical protein
VADISNPVALYDQVTTTWEKVRANVLSHLIAVAWLWFIGFSPRSAALHAFVSSAEGETLRSAFHDEGFFAFLTICLTLLIAIYGVVLNEVGQILLRIILVFSPTNWMLIGTKLVPSQALFKVAATLEGDVRQSQELEPRIVELITTYSLSRVAEWKEAMSVNSKMQGDAVTHLRNATVFLVLWAVAPTLIRASRLEGVSVNPMYLRGLLGFAIYFLVSRARLIRALELTIAQSTLVAASFVTKDPEFSDCLKAARSNPEPYAELVDRYLAQDLPSFRGFLRARFRQIFHKETRIPSMLMKFRHFGWDRKANLNYEDSTWLPKYLAWRLVELWDRLRIMVRSFLVSLGLMNP